MRGSIAYGLNTLGVVAHYLLDHLGVRNEPRFRKCLPEALPGDLVAAIWNAGT